MAAHDSESSTGRSHVLHLRLSVLMAFNVVAGFVLLSLSRRSVGLMLVLTFAFAIHVVRSDQALAPEHDGQFGSKERLLLAAALVAGAAVGIVVDAASVTVRLLAALVVGGIAFSLWQPHQRSAR